MTCYAPSTIPKIIYGSYVSPRPYCPAPGLAQVYTRAYGAPPKPRVGTVIYEGAHEDDLSRVRTSLRQLLNENKLRNMPVGFPFHVRAQNSDEIRLSHAPYEFKEYFATSDNRSRSRCATFSYSLSRSGMMTWRITAPGRQSSDGRDCEFYFDNRFSYVSQPGSYFIGNETLAQVQLHPMVLETAAFGIEFMTRPKILLQALSTSLEVGKMITIQIANDKTRIFCRSKHIYYTSGEILFVSTDHLGQHEVVFVYVS